MAEGQLINGMKWLWPKGKSSFLGFLESPVSQEQQHQGLCWDEGMQGHRASARNVMCCVLRDQIYLCPTFLGGSFIPRLGKEL